MDALGPRIKQLRLLAKLNKAALARQVGVSDVTISYWESGAIKQIGHERLVALAEALGCPLSRLLDDEPRDPATVLYLRHEPPAPWHHGLASPIILPDEMLSTAHLKDGCHLITPAEGEGFDFLAQGELAAVSPIPTFQAPGLYLVEHRQRLQLRRLDQEPSGELRLSGDPALGGEAVIADASLRILGKVQARWRRIDD